MNYRCKSCPNARGKAINYQVDSYGNTVDGYKFYEDCQYVRASNVCFFEKKFLEAYFCDIHHCTTTLSGKAESYNEMFKSSEGALFCQDFVKSNSRADFLDDEDAVVDYDGDDEICTEARKNKPYFWEMSR